MHATIHRYECLRGTPEDMMRATRQLASVLSKAPGFVSYALLDVGDGVVMSVSVFETHGDLAEADRLVGSWAAEHLAVLLSQPPQRTTGEVIVQKGM